LRIATLQDSLPIAGCRLRIRLAIDDLLPIGHSVPIDDSTGNRPSIRNRQSIGNPQSGDRQSMWQSGNPQLGHCT
jgi:hypothetical protein